MRTNRLCYVIPYLLVASVAGCGESEDTGAPTNGAGDDAAAVGEVDSGGVVAYENSVNHDDAVDSPEDTSWITPMSSDASGAIVRILLTDAPMAAENVFVTVCGIDVENKTQSATEKAGTSTWYRVSDQCREVDLLSLQDGVTEAMGIGELPPGDYGRIRLMLQEGTMVRNGVEEPLALTAEGEGGGFAIDTEFSVAEGDAATLTVDFDAGESVHEASGGGYELRPALSVVGVQTRARVRTGMPDSADPNDQDGAGGASGDGSGKEPAQGDASGESSGDAAGDGSAGDGAGGAGDGPDGEPAQGEGAGDATGDGPNESIGDGAGGASGDGAADEPAQGDAAGDGAADEPAQGDGAAGAASDGAVGDGSESAPSDGADDALGEGAGGSMNDGAAEDPAQGDVSTDGTGDAAGDDAASAGAGGVSGDSAPQEPASGDAASDAPGDSATAGSGGASGAVTGGGSGR